MLSALGSRATVKAESEQSYGASAASLVPFDALQKGLKYERDYRRE